MDPAVIGTRLASGALGPLLRKLLAADGPGAGLPGQARRVRLSSLVSFRGEKRTLTEKDVRRLAATLVERATAGPGEQPFPADEAEAVTDALATTLLALGDLDMDDVQAVALGHEALAARLRAAAPSPDGLASASLHFLDAVTVWACRHILEFFTQRSAFVPRTLVEQARGQSELHAKADMLLARLPHADVQDADFERRYLAHLAKKHGRLVIYGIDLHHSPDQWPLDTAYLSLEATAPGPVDGSFQEGGEWLGSGGTGQGPSTDGFAYPTPPGSGVVRADLALAQHDRILLRGLAGSGKTTLVQWLTVSAATGQQAEGMAYLHGRVPFVLPLRTLTRHGERLPAAAHFLSSAGCPLTAPDGWADRVLSAGRGLVLVDGIDEIPEAERGRARQWLRDLLAAYGDGNRWLVTSRPSAVGDAWLAADGFAELTLAPMTRTEVTTFVRRWHRAAGPAAAPYEQPLLDALRATEEVAGLATNPLMCGLICALHRDRRGFLPRGRKALYEAALSMLLSRRDRERDMGSPTGIELGEAPQIQLVQRLAYWLALNGRTQMDRRHAESLVSSAVPAVQEASAYDPGAVFTHLLHRSGLLREPTADTVDFVHRTFQDYLAAKALVEQWDIGVLAAHAEDDQWEDVIRMALGHARPRECAELLEELMKAADRAEDRRGQQRVLVLAVSALDQVTEVAPHVRQAVLDRASEVFPPRTQQEARVLGEVGRLALGLLPDPEGLGDEEALMMVTAASHIRTDAAIPYLARFAGHPSLRVRSQLIWSWHRFDSRSYAEEVVARLDPSRLRYFVANDEQAGELLRLGLRPALLEIAAGVSGPSLAELLGACDPAQLRMRRGGGRPDLSALAPLTRLSSLVLGLDADARWSTTALPARAPIEHLELPHVWPEDGLGALGRFRELTSLNLWRAPVADAGTWRSLAALPSLRVLALDRMDLPSCPDGLVLDTVRTVRLVHDGTAKPGEVTAVFPHVERIELVDSQDRVQVLSP
ncbi:NACHT domain-containing protein [Streptomyces sp. NPDC012637]|uniref:NACHT domain-containing protein n=1 Tax=Streptomyces sp. NPDC012637 TaxID=3364842 RepID=UPI0036E6728F